MGPDSSFDALMSALAELSGKISSASTNIPNMDDTNDPPRTLAKRNVASVTDYIRSGLVRKCVFLVGAGISTSAGIPDFRSPDTGLYANLSRLKLPYPEAVFDISFFRRSPAPFYSLAKELFPGKFRPTIAHSFMKLLCDKGIVSKVFTQNIDCLERAAGIPPELIVEAHGSFATHACIDCKTSYPNSLMTDKIMAEEIPRCLAPTCNGIVKPNIVFFGEPLPSYFHNSTGAVAEADLVIVMGTSLSVMPFASLPQRVRYETPRVLINREIVGGIGLRRDDVLILSDVDNGVRRFAKELGWLEELEAIWEETRLDKKADKGKGKERSGSRPGTAPGEYDGPKDIDEILRAQVESLSRDVGDNLKNARSHRDFVEEQLKMEERRKSNAAAIVVAEGIRDKWEKANSEANHYDPQSPLSPPPPPSQSPPQQQPPYYNSPIASSLSQTPSFTSTTTTTTSTITNTSTTTNTSSTITSLRASTPSTPGTITNPPLTPSYRAELLALRRNVSSELQARLDNGYTSEALKLRPVTPPERETEYYVEKDGRPVTVGKWGRQEGASDVGQLQSDIVGILNEFGKVGLGGDSDEKGRNGKEEGKGDITVTTTTTTTKMTITQVTTLPGAESELSQSESQAGTSSSIPGSDEKKQR